MQLAELLVAALLLGLVAAASVPALQQVLHAYADGAARVEAQQSARVALDRLARHVRAAGFGGPAESFAAVAIAEPSRIVLQQDLDEDGAIAGGGETVAWRLAGDVLRRDAGGGAQPIVNGVRALAFGYLDEAGAPTSTPAAVRAVRIELTTQPTTASSATTAGIVTTVATLVRLRNR